MDLFNKVRTESFYLSPKTKKLISNSNLPCDIIVYVYKRPEGDILIDFCDIK